MRGFVLFLLVFALMAGGALVALRQVPPQHLPWTPLSLEQPAGLATAHKLTRLEADPQRCRALLASSGLTVKARPDRPDAACPTAGVVQITEGALTLTPRAPPMTCGQALAYVLWTRHAVQPAAWAELGEPIARIDHYGTFACRNIAGRDVRSQHATANALDVAGFRTASGKRITVAADFRDEGPKGRFLRRVRDSACPWFRAVLSPDYNAAHADHLHLDRGPFGQCA